MSDRVQSRLEPDRAERARLLDLFAKFSQDELDRIDAETAGAMPTRDAMVAAASLQVSIPEAPLDGGAPAILQVLEDALRTTLPTPGAGYLAYVPGGGIYTAALADFVAACCNRYTGLAMAAPGLCRLEADVLRWLAGAFGFGPEARGLLTTGGSLANFGAIVTARHDRFGESGDHRGAFAYTSAQIHHSVAKSVSLAGIPRANLRLVDVDARFRLDLRDLRARIEADRAAGGDPFMVVASAGSTNTGAIDPLPELAAFCRSLNLWLHVDGAYGGAFVLAPEGKRRLAGIELADSVVFDPHKGLFLPYGTGCLLVREGQKLRAAHSLGADYLQDFDDTALDAVIPNPTEYGPELTRGFRGLRLWLPLMIHGAAAFREALSEKLELAEVFHRALARRHADAIEIVDAPQLSVVPFRVRRRPREPLAAWDERNRRLMQRVNEAGRVFLSSTRLPVADGMAFTNRICVLSFRTHREHIDACLEDLARALPEVT